MSDILLPEHEENREELAELLKADGMRFFRYFFKVRTDQRLIINWHHYVVEYCLQAVIDGHIQNLIINVPPGYTKTEHAIISFIARGFAINPKSKFIHVTTDKDLALENSGFIRDTIKSDQYQGLFDFPLKKDKGGLGKWGNDYGGMLLAKSSGQNILGFRAGLLDASGFSGAFMVDDPLKVDDMYSDSKRTKINNRFSANFKTRLAKDDTTPFIVTMQRLHPNDPCDHLLRGGMGRKFHHVELAAIHNNNKQYPEEYTHGIPIRINDILHSIHTGAPYDFSR